MRNNRYQAMILFLAILSCKPESSKKMTSNGILSYQRFIAASIIGNHGGEVALRRLTIYTPPGYLSGKQRYPVIYLLHGYEMNDSITEADIRLSSLLDTAITTHRIKPVIVVLPNSYTKYKGSFYTNSELTGKWSDYISQDVVQYIDKHYRSIPMRNSRGLAGISMGGNGALKIAMLHPEVFGTVYANSPAVLDWSSAINPYIKAFQKIATMSDTTGNPNDFLTTLLIDLARTYSPNNNTIPFQADMPAKYHYDKMILQPEIIKKWENNLPTKMISSHVNALKSLRAIKLEWGRNDEGKHVPITCINFSKMLEQYGIKHYAEGYLGGHASHLSGTKGRIYTDLLPFFDTYLEYKNNNTGSN